MTMTQKRLLLVLILIVQSCASYQTAQQIKIVSFDFDKDKNFTQGTSIGPIKGEACAWTIFGHQIGESPTVERAISMARNRNHKDGQQLRYINNLSSNMKSFNAGVLSKQCVTVTGIGYL